MQGTSKPSENFLLFSENALMPTVMFNQLVYQEIENGDCHEFIIKMLIEGLEKCNQFHEIPINELLNAISEFRLVGYKNEWVPIRKLFRSIGLHCSLLCSLNSSRFELTLQIERKGETLFKRPILETQPDELIFGYRYKDIKLIDESIVVLDKFGEITFSLDVNKFI
ncbi:MAG: hypothetical protein ACK4NN_12215 [Rheinheimera sp.]